MMTKLRHDRAAWVAHCRALRLAQQERLRSDDGMSHGIIPFGAPKYWEDMEASRLADALAAPVPARITGWDASGVGLALTCPYCERPHRHIVQEEGWRADEPLTASCGRGSYRIALIAAPLMGTDVREKNP